MRQQTQQSTDQNSSKFESGLGGPLQFFLPFRSRKAPFPGAGNPLLAATTMKFLDGIGRGYLYQRWKSDRALRWSQIRMETYWTRKLICPQFLLIVNTKLGMDHLNIPNYRNPTTIGQTMLIKSVSPSVVTSLHLDFGTFGYIKRRSNL